MGNVVTATILSYMYDYLKCSKTLVFICIMMAALYTSVKNCLPFTQGWYGHCVRLIVSKQGGSRGIKIRQSEITPEAMFGPKKLLESPHL